MMRISVKIVCSLTGKEKIFEWNLKELEIDFSMKGSEECIKSRCGYHGARRYILIYKKMFKGFLNFVQVD